MHGASSFSLPDIHARVSAGTKISVNVVFQVANTASLHYSRGVCTRVCFELIPRHKDRNPI